MGLSTKSNFLLDRAPQKSVNASRAALRLPAHDSGSGWLATPYPCDFFIRELGRGLARYSEGAAYQLLPVSSGSASLVEP